MKFGYKMEKTIEFKIIAGSIIVLAFIFDLIMEKSYFGMLSIVVVGIFRFILDLFPKLLLYILLVFWRMVLYLAISFWADKLILTKKYR